mgnify:CR=1 FL=1
MSLLFSLLLPLSASHRKYEEAVPLKQKIIVYFVVGWLIPIGIFIYFLLFSYEIKMIFNHFHLHIIRTIRYNFLNRSVRFP